MQRLQINEISERLKNFEVKDLSASFSKFAVVGIQLREQKGEVQILFIQRAIRDSDPWSGQIGFPGGHAEPNETDFLSTLQREYQEEMGCVWQSDLPIIRLDDVQARKSGQLLDFFIRPICFFSNSDSFSYQHSEIAGHFWVPLSRLMQVEFHTDFLLQRKSMQISLPAIRIVDQEQSLATKAPPLWGLSYMMTEILLKKLSEVGLIEWPRHWRSYPSP